MPMELIFWTNVSDLMKGSPLTDSKAITRSHQEKSLIYRKKKKKTGLEFRLHCGEWEYSQRFSQNDSQAYQAYVSIEVVTM